MLVKGEPNISYICSRYYRAPELIFGATDYSAAIDLWSVGCVMAELLLGQPLFPGESGVDQLVEIIKVGGCTCSEGPCTPLLQAQPRPLGEDNCGPFKGHCLMRHLAPGCEGQVSKNRSAFRQPGCTTGSPDEQDGKPASAAGHASRAWAGAPQGQADGSAGMPFCRCLGRRHGRTYRA